MAAAPLASAMVAAAMIAATPVAAAPERVVSINLCTDQLAMLVAAPGQLHSVSWLAADPASSTMAGDASAYALNHGQAEEVFVMQPDLVLAGAYSPRATVALLRRLGFTVIEFTPEASLDDLRANLRAMGAALGREARAEALVAAFDARLAAVPPAADPRPRAAIFSPNAYTSGTGTLAHAVVEAAGLSNIAAERGIVGMARLPLEALVMEAPEVLITDRAHPTPALAEEILTHPALAALTAGGAATVVPDSAWICGTPATADAVARLAGLRQGVGGD